MHGAIVQSRKGKPTLCRRWPPRCGVSQWSRAVPQASLQRRWRGNGGIGNQLVTWQPWRHLGGGQCLTVSYNPLCAVVYGRPALLRDGRRGYVRVATTVTGAHLRMGAVSVRASDES